MKILLQHNRTLQYLRSNNTWTKTASDARNFPNTQAAIDHAYANAFLNVYIAVKFAGTGADDVVVPLPERCPSLDAEPVVLSI